MARNPYKAVGSVGAHHCLSRNISKAERRRSHKRVRQHGKALTGEAMLATRKPVEEVQTADEARELAIDLSYSQESMSWLESAQLSDYFSQLAEKFPELTDEFKENGII